VPRRRETHVLVQRMRSETGMVGGTKLVADGDPVRIPVNIYELSTEERITGGLTNVTTKRIHMDRWVGDLNNRISTPDGREWDQIGDAEEYGHGQLTKHLELTIRKRGK
jgi:hypothetical protein